MKLVKKENIKKKVSIPKNITKKNIDLFNQALGNDSSSCMTGTAENLQEGTQTKAWMIRNDGEVFPIPSNSFHPYGNEDDYEETIWAAEWLYDHTASNDAKEAIIKFLACWVWDETNFTESTVADQLLKEIASRKYKFLSPDFVTRHADEFEKVDVENCDLDELNRFIITSLNNEFLRARAGGETNSDHSMGDFYFRVSSTNGFNWFDLIWKFIYDRKSQVDTVTIKTDDESLGKNTFYRKGRFIFDRLPVEDFIMIQGSPFVGEHFNGRLGMKLKLVESLLFEDDEEVVDEVEDKVEEQPDSVDTVEVDADYEEENTLKERRISFPIIFKASNSKGDAIDISKEEREQVASEYADAVTNTIEENKKFILTALDVYDLECYYKELDANNFVTFIATVDESVKADFLMNVLKRYFDLQIDEVTLKVDGEEATIDISPVLDNRYITVI